MSDTPKETRKTVLPLAVPGQLVDQQLQEQAQAELSMMAGVARGELLHNMYPSAFPSGAIVSEENYHLVMRVTARNLHTAMLMEFSKLFTQRGE